MGLSKAIKEALVKALTKVHSQGVPKDSFIFLDGSLKVDEKYAQETIIKGDEKVPEIALASIIAKTHRDIFMKKIADVYPAYGFEKHVGYGTKAHYTAITTHGLTPLHRRSFLKGFA
jgi:ribonuclease HII